MRVARDEFIFHVTPLRQEPVEISTAASEQRRSPCACRRNCVYANNRCVKVRACDASFRWFRTMRCLHISVCVCAIFIIVFWLIYYARSRPTTLSLARSFNLDVCVNSLLIAFTNSTLDIRNNTRHCNCVCTSVFNEKTWIYLCETHLYGQLKFSNSHFLQIISLISAILRCHLQLKNFMFLRMAMCYIAFTWRQVVTNKVARTNCRPNCGFQSPSSWDYNASMVTVHTKM